MKSHMPHKSRAGNFKGWARSAEDRTYPQRESLIRTTEASLVPVLKNALTQI